MIRKFKKKIKKYIVKLFYDKKYLKGKYFLSDDSRGWNFAFQSILFQKILRCNSAVPWPMSYKSKICNYRNIVFDVDDINNFQSPGCYFQNFNAQIYIGKNTYIAPNVGLITANHDIYNLDNHVEGKDIILGKNCWIGMNSIILPGVKLGDRTIVGAGAVVTKSFEEGNVIIGGNPAKIIRKI